MDEFRPEAVLLDLGMPKLDGYEACRKIREKHGTELIIVALTGWGQSMDRERTRAAGFTQHLVKPVDYLTLLKELDGLRSCGNREGETARNPTGNRAALWGRNLLKSLGREQAHDESDRGNNEEQNEQRLRNTCRGGCDSTKPEDRGDDRQHEETQSPA